jgi:IS30 family transposase
MGRSKHLTAEERDMIYVLHAEQKSPAEIGRISAGTSQQYQGN